MPTGDNTLRVLVVDDNRDGADALGLLLEELGNQVHVTYGGAKALEVATAFRPDLLLVDLLHHRRRKLADDTLDESLMKRDQLLALDGGRVQESSLLVFGRGDVHEKLRRFQ
jgi:CheY-like chemotaxis protein